MFSLKVDPSSGSAPMPAGTPVSNDLFSQALQQALQASNMSGLQVSNLSEAHSVCSVPGGGVVVCITVTRWGLHKGLSFLIVTFCVCQGRWQSQLQQLRDMGIQDEELMLRALQATDGDIQAALELIFAGGPGL